MEKNYLSAPKITELLKIASKTFYNVRNNNPEKIRMIQEGQKKFYHFDDFMKEASKGSLKFKVDAYKRSLETTTSENREVSTEEKDISKKKEIIITENNNSNIYNNPYVDELKKQIDKLEKEKKEDKYEFKRIETDLRSELNNEKSKSEKVFFFSERIDKVIRDKQLLMKYMVQFLKNIQLGNKVHMEEFKMLITQNSISEKITIDPDTGTIDFSKGNNNELINALEQINGNLLIGESKEKELNDEIIKNKNLSKQIKIKNISLGIVFIALMVFLLVMIFSNYIKF